MKTKFLLIAMLASLMANISFSQVNPASPEYDFLKSSGAFAIPKQVVNSGPVTTIVPTLSATDDGCLLIPLDMTTFSYLYGNDDYSTGQINFPFNFNFYGTIQNYCWINNNGNVSFDGPYSSYTASGFPVNGYPMLAPFWADVDTRNAGSGLMWYKVEPHRVIVIWDAVGYYPNAADKLNKFELIFTDGTDPLIGIGNNVAFSYDDMQWTTGSASGGSGGFGGVPSTCGVNKGDGSVYALIGRFDHEGIDYDGPGGIADGVSYLDCKNFFFNTSNSSNIPPVASGFPASPVTINVGDVWNYSVQFLSPEIGQITTTVLNDGGLTDFLYTITDGNVSQIDMQITGTLNNLGTHTIVFTASDDGVPAGVTTVYLDIIVESTVGPCPLTATWNGSLNGDWMTADNWTTPLGAVVPCDITFVTIPGGVPNYPTLVANASCASILIEDGGSFIGAERLDVANAEVQRYFTNSNFHFLSSPVQSINFGTVFPLNQLAVWAREYNEPSGDWVNLFIADYMEVGKGYSIEMTESQMATFPGIFNSTDVTKPLLYANTGGDPNRVGWNLLGNPFQSSLSWNIILNAGGPIPIVEAAAYVWNGVQYVSWNGFTGSLTNGIIPPQNGFFVKAIAPGFSFNIPLAARVHSNIPFYKNNIADLLILKAEGNAYADETFIRFNEEATPLFDADHDAYKLWGLENAPQLYSIVPGDVLSINELPFQGNEVVDLGFKCNTSGTYSITASGIDNFSALTPIFIEDLTINYVQDLRQNPEYSFNYNTSDQENRFKIHFKSTTGFEDPLALGIKVYGFDHTVVFNNTTGLTGDVRIYDLAGRKLKDATMSSTTATRIHLQVATGTYIVKVTTAKGTVNTKVFIK